jgi:hypothetical protein
MERPQIDDELESLRQCVIEARRTPAVEQPASESLERLRGLYSARKAEFTSEDIRFINVLKGFLKERIEAHRQPQVDPKTLDPGVRMDRRRRGGGEAYWARIRTTLDQFCRPTDQLHCPRVFILEGQTCKLCGHWPITWNHVLRNARTGQELIVGSECIVNYKEEMSRLGHQVPPVIFRSPGAAKYMNRQCPGIAVVGSVWSSEYEAGDPEVHESYEDQEYEAEREWLMELGLDPDDPYFTDLAPHGMSGDEDDDAETDDER